MRYIHQNPGRATYSFLSLFAILFFTSAIPAAAQLSSPEPDPLARIRDAANSGVPACSATGETLCEQVAPKITENALGESPLAQNIRRAREGLGGFAGPGSLHGKETIGWIVSAIRDSGMESHNEKYTSPEKGRSETLLENVVVEVKGREKPEEWVLVGAYLDGEAAGPGVIEYYCNAATVIEAARDIFRTGIRPRRSIRFVIFAGHELNAEGSWAYVRTHRGELDGARAAIIQETGCSRMAGYSLNGRQDIENGLQEGMKPVKSFGAKIVSSGPWVGAGNFDFLLNGVPTLSADRTLEAYTPDPVVTLSDPDDIPLSDLKHNAALIAVTAFGIAERATPLGPRQTRAEIESTLKTSGLEQQMKTAGLWPLWESGERGRMP